MGLRRPLRLVADGKHDMYREERVGDEPQAGVLTRLPNPFHLQYLPERPVPPPPTLVSLKLGRCMTVDRAHVTVWEGGLVVGIWPLGWWARAQAVRVACVSPWERLLAIAHKKKTPKSVKKRGKRISRTP